jgi:hypothetical protein
MTRCAFLILTTWLAGAPLAAARASELPDLSSETQTFSATAGTIVGAASQCSDISGARVAKAAETVSRALGTVGETQDDVAQARRRFTDTLQAGRDAVRSGELSCHEVEAALTRLEHLGDRAAH